MENKNDTIKNKVLDEINTQNVKPKSVWYFRAQHAALWTPGILVTILGSFAVAGILFSAVHAGWQYREYTNRSFVGFLYQVIPLLWIGSLILFGGLIVKMLRLTSRGYRYKTGAILIFSFIVSIILGTAIFALDLVVKNNSIVRFQAEKIQQNIWTSPEEGRLAGVISIGDNDTFILTDINGKQWYLDIDDILNKESIIDGASVRIVGEAYNDQSFWTCLILPWDLSPINHNKVIPLGPHKMIEDQEKLSSHCRDIIMLHKPQNNILPERNFQTPS